MSIFGAGFIDGALVLVVYGMGELANASVGPMGMVIMMTGRSGLNLINSILFCTINIVLNFLLIPMYGIIGAAIATGFAVASINIMRMTEVYSLLHILPFKISFFKPFAAGILSFAAMYPIVTGFSDLSLVWFMPLAIIYLALYVAIVLLLKLDDEDRLVIGMVSRKFNSIRADVLNAK